MRTLITIQTLLLALPILAVPSLGQRRQSSPSGDRPIFTVPANGQIKVAFVMTDGSVMIDFAGPWEVFQDVMISANGRSIHEPGVRHPFQLYVVSDNKQPIRMSGGMQVTPNYSFDDAPEPNVIVIPAQDGASPKMMDWIRRMAKRGDVVMSVCTGVFTLAQTGLLDGKNATTHHDNWGLLHTQFPTITVLTNRRYVQSDRLLFTSGGLSAGIDLALHIVELYFGRRVAAATAYTMEYEATGWKTGLATVRYKDGMAGMKMGKTSPEMK